MVTAIFHKTYALPELPRIAKEVLLFVEKKKVEDKATVLALSGELGAGKTTLTQVIADLLGVKEVVRSPTYTIMQTYHTSEHALFKELVHIDAYRLSGGEDAEVSGVTEKLAHGNALVMIEWPEMIQTVLPQHTLFLQLKEGAQDAERKLTLTSFDGDSSAVNQVLR